MANGGFASAPMLDAIMSGLPDSLNGAKRSALERFIRIYYQQLPASDLGEASAEDFGGAALAHWHLLQQRHGSEALVNVYNPVVEIHGWQCRHTVVEVVCDDMSELVSSVSMAVSEAGHSLHLTLHPLLMVQRDRTGKLIELCHGETDGAQLESVIHIQIDRIVDAEQLHAMRDNVSARINLLRKVNADRQAMEERRLEIVDMLTRHSALDDEITQFLQWLDSEQFDLFGCESFLLADSKLLQRNLDSFEGKSLGLLRDTPTSSALQLADLVNTDIQRMQANGEALSMAKANLRSPIARPELLDVVAVIAPSETGNLLLHCLVGQFTAAMHARETAFIPWLRTKSEAITRAASLDEASHAGKALRAIVEAMPRDMLFQTSTEQALDIAQQILGLQDRQRIRLFGTRAPTARYYNCLVYIPRDHYSRDLRLRIESILLSELGGIRAEFSTHFSSEHLLANLHYVVQLNQPASTEPDWDQIEQRIIQASVSWEDRLHTALLSKHDEDKANRLYQRYRNAFPSSYREDYSARIACSDIAFIEDHVGDDAPVMSFYRHIFADVGTINFKIFSPQRHIALSDVIPVIENMGLRVDAEHPFQVNREGVFDVWIHEFTVQHEQGNDIDAADSGQRMADAFSRIWQGDVENDRFNQLILEAGLDWRQTVVLRSYCRYLQQIKSPFTPDYIVASLVANAHIAQLLVELFETRFDPARERDDAAAAALEAQLETAMADVQSLDEDRILRAYMNLTNATLRTNFYCSGDAEPLDYVSFKFDSAQIDNLPLPRPDFEIFVYSPRVEGIHLRGGPVARGGLRWSDRREDFRTEVLGLMKAQMVKNAVIVPVGSKGGFYVKRPPANADRDAHLREGIACYQTFLRGLLDITDNIVDNEIVAPANVRRYDTDDPYLVVAADKGTATFSDYANDIADAYGFWLGDAFASGGSAGYDHKKMGITARGAWESVKRHFRESGSNTQTDAFTVVGIGDMAGDVFGNGMLLSEHIRLVAAFNHQHIFIDPEPDAATTFAERQRLFDLPGSSWSDYDTTLISTGGGIYSRSSKRIDLSDAARTALGIEATSLTPTELIHQILQAPVDLLWNGGIGTYIKAEAESHAEVNDRANDALRVSATQLRCRVVGEGGNLGCSQLGRIEFAQAGGSIYTDAIDNSAGVDCSDHEVNIKILLNSIVKNGDMTRKQRDQRLAEMTDEVAALVLQDNYLQTQCISLCHASAIESLEEDARFIDALEADDLLNREIEYLPSKDEIAERQGSNRGLVAPELAVLVSYSKMTLYDQLLASSLPDEPYLESWLCEYFPTPLGQNHPEIINTHRLRREIIATSVTNALVNRLGPTFVFRMQQELGASHAEVASAFVVATEIFSLPALWLEIEALDNIVPNPIQTTMLQLVRGLVERTVHWLLRSRRQAQSIDAQITYFRAGAERLIASLPDSLASANQRTLQERCRYFADAGAPDETAMAVARVVPLSSALDLVDIADSLSINEAVVAGVYFELGGFLDLQWLRDEIAQLAVRSYWHTRAKSELRSDLHYQHRYLCAEVLGRCGGTSAIAATDAPAIVTQWAQGNRQQIAQYQALINDMRAQSSVDFAMLSLAVNEVHKLLSSDRPL